VIVHLELARVHADDELTGEEEEQMKERGSFVGWDFVGETANGAGDIWWILEGQDYPCLQWEQVEAGQ